ncbi:hypothetical protein R3P38DRAFT_3283082 [Favolaschia claudopus]|uniref:Uncharacterized protein n=1 Tax=Favolaschia claudopus TaxID=2862362 RepID=A0AAW0AAV6_9AGAR
MAPHVQILGNYSEVKFIDEKTQEDFIQFLSEGSRDPAIREAARQQVLGWKTEFEARVAQGPYPVLGETPEETHRPAYQTNKLSDGKHIIRFFPGGGRPGMLFFDFVRIDTGARATPGYDVYQLSPHHPEKLMPLYDIIDPERRGPIATTPPTLRAVGRRPYQSRGSWSPRPGHLH